MCGLKLLVKKKNSVSFTMFFQQMMIEGRKLVIDTVDRIEGKKITVQPNYFAPHEGFTVNSI